MAPPRYKSPFDSKVMINGLFGLLEGAKTRQDLLKKYVSTAWYIENYEKKHLMFQQQSFQFLHFLLIE